MRNLLLLLQQMMLDGPCGPGLWSSCAPTLLDKQVLGNNVAGFNASCFSDLTYGLSYIG